MEKRVMPHEPRIQLQLLTIYIKTIVLWGFQMRVLCTCIICVSLVSHPFFCAVTTQRRVNRTSIIGISMNAPVPVDVASFAVACEWVANLYEERTTFTCTQKHKANGYVYCSGAHRFVVATFANHIPTRQNRLLEKNACLYVRFVRGLLAFHHKQSSRAQTEPQPKPSTEAARGASETGVS